jgi:hypothetical protein
VQRRTNALDDDRQSADDELVGKSKNAKSGASKPFIPPGDVLSLIAIVLSAWVLMIEILR